MSEEFAFGDFYEWRLKDAEIRFRGRGHYEKLVLQRIPASTEQIATFFRKLDELQVWDWRAYFDPMDADYVVMDGSVWSFQADFEDWHCKTAGHNAYPSLEDPAKIAMNDGEGRWGLLHAGLYQCFNIPHYIELAEQFRNG